MVMDIKEGGRSENGFFRMLIHNGERALALHAWPLGPGVPDRVRLEMAKSLSLYDVWSESATMPISEATPLHANVTNLQRNNVLF